MEISKLAKNISMVLSLLAVMIVIVAGSFIASDLYRTSPPDSQVKTLAQISIEQPNPKLSQDFGVLGSCSSPYIYTSLPAKCKTIDGEFIPLNDLAPNIVVLPESK
jgi:hypothetical protein